MTKTKVESSPPFFSLLSRIPRTARSMPSGEAQERRAPRHAPVGPSDRAQPRPRARDSPSKPAAEERAKRAEKSHRASPGSHKPRGKTAGRRRPPEAVDGGQDSGKDAGSVRVKLLCTDSSSEVSDSTSEESKTALTNDGQSSDGETRGMEETRQKGPEDLGQCDHLPLPMDPLTSPHGYGQRSISPGDEQSFASLDSRLNFSSSLAFSDLTGDFTEGLHGELLREVEELRSENEYLKVQLFLFCIISPWYYLNQL